MLYVMSSIDINQGLVFLFLLGYETPICATKLLALF